MSISVVYQTFRLKVFLFIFLALPFSLCYRQQGYIRIADTDPDVFRIEFIKRDRLIVILDETFAIRELF
jgi:hypothetical protein